MMYLMTAVREHVVLPPSDVHAREELAEIAELVSTVVPELLGHDGRRVALSGPVRDVLVRVVTALQAGQAVTVGPFPTRLTTQQAADLLGVSRPTLVKMLDDGKIAYERPGEHRRLRLEDVLAYRARRRVEREQAMTVLVRQTEDLGLYDDDES
jgi:excisionase family DNA binding protein